MDLVIQFKVSLRRIKAVGNATSVKTRALRMDKLTPIPNCWLTAKLDAQSTKNPAIRIRELAIIPAAE